MSPEEEWAEVQETAEIISANSRRKISTDYVRILAYKGRIRTKWKDGRTLLYNTSDARKISVKSRTKQTDSQQDGGAEKAA